MGWFVALGIDVNRDYPAFSWLTNDADYAASALQVFFIFSRPGKPSSYH